MAVKYNFSGKTVFVTGGSKGIGKAIAEGFLKSGANVIVCARGEKDLQKLKDAYSGYPLLTLQGDAASEVEAERMLKEASRFFLGIDILVNNVGGAIKFGDFWSLSNQDWLNSFQLNLLSMVNFSREAIPYLRKSEVRRIINISSISGVEPGYYNPHYAAMKSATINFSKYLSNSLAKERILVNCVCPGSIETDAWDKSIEQIAKERGVSEEELEKELREQESLKIPLGVMGKGEDISPIVLFLASPEAQWITGSCFHLNGGKLKAMC